MFNFFIQKLLNNKIQLEIDKKQEELNTINLQLQIYKKELDETINLLGTNKGLIELQDIGIEYIPEITSFVEINTKIDQIKKEINLNSKLQPQQQTQPAKLNYSVKDKIEKKVDEKIFTYINYQVDKFNGK